MEELKVVLSKEEYDALKKQIEYWEYSTKVARQELFEERKETAEKFAEMVKEKCKELQDKYSHICKSKFEMIQETCRYEGVTAVKNSIAEICEEIRGK